MDKKPLLPSSMDFYQDNTNLMWIILVVSVFISTGSIYFSDVLVGQLKEREKNQVKLFARALEYSINDTENNILFITEEIINKNNSIPTILTNKGIIVSFINVDLDPSWSQQRKEEYLQAELVDMKKTFQPIEILLKDPRTQEVYGKQYVYYKNSFLLKQLIWYPYIQIFVLAIF